MAMTALLGAIFGIGLFLTSMLLSTSDAMIFLSLSSFLMVMGGTIATTFMSYQATDVITAFKAIGWMLHKPKSTREGLNTEIGRLIAWAYLVQKKGLPAIEDEIKRVQPNDPIMRYLLELVAANHKPEELKIMMETAVEADFERRTHAVTVLKTMGAAAPAFGMIGTLVGLVGVLQSMGTAGDDLMELVGTGMALALITTLYGVVFARMMFIPAAVRLESKEEVERFRNHMVVEGLILLSQKRTPRFMQDHLNGFLDPDNQFDIDRNM